MASQRAGLRNLGRSGGQRTAGSRVGLPSQRQDQVRKGMSQIRKSKRPVYLLPSAELPLEQSRNVPWSQQIHHLRPSSKDCWVSRLKLPTLPTALGARHPGKTRFEIRDRGIRTHFFVKNKATKLLKIQRSVAESDKTIPISDIFGIERFEAKVLGEDSPPFPLSVSHIFCWTPGCWRYWCDEEHRRQATLPSPRTLDKICPVSRSDLTHPHTCAALPE